MRTLNNNRLVRGIFFIFLLLTLTACTGREDIVLELDGRGEEAESVPEEGAESISETADEGVAAAGNLFAQAASGTEAGQAAEPVQDAGGTSAVQENVLPDIYVHICGAVENPGVYILAAGSRVYAGIAAAGGFREDACEDFINQAGILQDGQRLAIPTMEEAEAARADGSEQALRQEEAQNAEAQVSGAESTVSDTSGRTGGLVNINTASEHELSAITGIGSGKAAAIVQYRQENGRFSSIEEIMKVSGIKEGTFEKIKDKITVN